MKSLANAARLMDGAISELLLEKLPVVDLPVEPRAVTPKTASMRLAILLFRGLLVFVGVVIITMTLSKSGELPDVQCKIGVVGKTTHSMLLLHTGGPSPIYGPIYEFVVKDIIRVPLPAAVMSKFMPCG
jgi:hypothetical protein